MNAQVIRRNTVIIRPIMLVSPTDDMNTFMDTFDQAITVSEEEEWEVWAKRNRVDQREVKSEDNLLCTFLGMSKYLKDPNNKGDLIEATYMVGCFNHGGETEYLTFLSFLLSQD
jgi:hypothetical protein